MKNYHYLLIISAALGFTGFTLWREFVCTDCFASEQETYFPEQQSESRVLEENQTLGEQELDQGPRAGSPAPNFVLENLVGDEVSLADFADQNVLVVFWDIACGWCEKERPDLIRIAKEQKGKVEIIALAPESKETLIQYVKEKDINFTILVDQARKTAIEYLALGTPSHFLIRQGKIAAVKPGYADYEYLLMMMQSLEEE